MTSLVDILIPTYNRPAALAVTLTSLAYQTYQDFRIVVSDQTPDYESSQCGEVKAISDVLRFHGHEIEFNHHLPQRGMAEQRQFLLDQAHGKYALFLDDDLILEQWVLELLLRVIKEEGCGFVGNTVIGLSHVDDFRPHQQQIEFWEGPVEPELVEPGTPKWDRYIVHNAANILHVQQKYHASLDHPLRYKVAWVAVGVLYDAEKLRSVGGFNFWKQLPAVHCGEDVLAQIRVMACYGGCGVLPTGIYHQELPTTLPDRSINAPKVLDILPVEGNTCTS